MKEACEECKYCVKKRSTASQVTEINGVKSYKPSDMIFLYCRLNPEEIMVVEDYWCGQFKKKEQ